MQLFTRGAIRVPAHLPPMAPPLTENFSRAICCEVLEESGYICGPDRGSWSEALEAHDGGDQLNKAVGMRGLTDDELVEVYERYGAFIRRQALRFFGSEATADDILMEAMLRLRRNGRGLMELERAGQRGGWLRTLTRRVCLDHYASIERERKVVQEACEGLEESRRLSLEERDLLDRLLERLNTEDRIMAVLHYEDGYAKMEIHHALGRSRPFIDARLDHVAKVLAGLAGEADRQPSTSARSDVVSLCAKRRAS